MPHGSGRTLASCILLVFVAACSWTAADPSPPPTAGSASTTTVAMTSSTVAAAPHDVHPVVVSHDDHLAVVPDPPLGLLPSFNESPGCDAPQGVRGPYADAGGRLPGDQPLGGPWGDFYGRTMDQIRDALVPMPLPSGEGSSSVVVYVHEHVAPALQGVIDNLEREREQGRWYRIDPASTFSYAPLPIPPGRYLSFHAVGAAVDINASTNPYSAENELITDMPDWFVEAWTDAGWCWGGSWQQIKDPMHFSWMGPRHTPGYTIPDRVEPTVPHGAFTRSVTVETGLGPAPGGSSDVVDLDRDGAVDGVRIVRNPVTGRLDVIAARAIHRYDTCVRLGPTPDRSEPSATHLMADATGDARPDLWELVPSDTGFVVTVFTFDSAYTRHLPTFSVPIAVTDVGSVHLADHDLDGMVDLHVVGAGPRPSVTVLGGPDFTRVVLDTTLDEVGGDWRYALGLRDLDRIPDLFAISPTEPARVMIFAGADGFTAEPERLDTAVRLHEGRIAAEDFDGDGHADLVVLDPDGHLTVYLGGDSAGVTEGDLMAWFLERDDRPWEYRAGCPQIGRTPR